MLTNATVFSQILAYTGVSNGLIKGITSLPMHPLLILTGMNIIVFIMGCFMDGVPIMLIIIPIFLPPLRNRVEDIPFLIEHFVEKLNTKTKKEVKGVTSEVLKLFSK
jgi:TRAP-type C4-dicarboxylate transport system permease large subunit